MRACVVCGRPGAGTRCDGCQPVEDRRRAAKSSAHGLNRRSWTLTRRSVLERDGGVCRLRLDGCDVAASSVHRLPQFGPVHDANPAAYVSACDHCHGVVDGARAHA